MNPQPDPSVGNFVAVIFCIAIIYYTIRSMQENTSFSINDNFIIGYLEPDPVVVVIPPSNPPPDRFKDPDPDPEPKTPSSSKNDKPKLTKDINSKLHTDCVDALVALGMKKKEAKERTKNIFLTMNPPPSSIQTFLLTALKIK